MQLTSCFDAIGHNKRACTVNLQNACCQECTANNYTIVSTATKTSSLGIGDKISFLKLSRLHVFFINPFHKGIRQTTHGRN